MNELNEITFKTFNEMLIFGLDEHGNLVDIDECENGLACNLVCPFCKNKLNAKNNGTFVTHHFAHAQGSNCKKGHEITLPLLIEKYLNKEKWFYVPHGNVKFGDESLNGSGIINVKEAKMLESNVEHLHFVEVTTAKNKKIAIFPRLNSDENEKYRIGADYDNVIWIDYSRFIDSDRSVKNVVIESLNKHQSFKKWIRRSDDTELIEIIKKLAIRKSYGKDRNGIEHFYCPKNKEIITNELNVCFRCQYRVYNLIKDGQTASEFGNKCLGYMDKIDRTTLLNTSISVPVTFPDPPLYDMKKYNYKNHDWFYLMDLPLLFPNKTKVVVYNFLLNRCFRIDFTTDRTGDWFVGYEIDVDCFMSKEKIMIPKEKDGFWRIAKLHGFDEDDK